MLTDLRAAAAATGGGSGGGGGSSSSRMGGGGGAAEPREITRRLLDLHDTLRASQARGGENNEGRGGDTPPLPRPSRLPLQLAALRQRRELATLRDEHRLSKKRVEDVRRVEGDRGGRRGCRRPQAQGTITPAAAAAAASCRATMPSAASRSGSSRQRRSCGGARMTTDDRCGPWRRRRRPLRQRLRGRMRRTRLPRERAAAVRLLRRRMRQQRRKQQRPRARPRVSRRCRLSWRRCRWAAVDGDALCFCFRPSSPLLLLCFDRQAALAGSQRRLRLQRERADTAARRAAARRAHNEFLERQLEVAGLDPADFRAAGEEWGGCGAEGRVHAPSGVR